MRRGVALRIGRCPAADGGLDADIQKEERGERHDDGQGLPRARGRSRRFAGAPARQQPHRRRRDREAQRADGDEKGTEAGGDPVARTQHQWTQRGAKPPGEIDAVEDRHLVAARHLRRHPQVRRRDRKPEPDAQEEQRRPHEHERPRVQTR
jgi:hypothetical protein